MSISLMLGRQLDPTGDPFAHRVRPGVELLRDDLPGGTLSAKQNDSRPSDETLLTGLFAGDCGELVFLCFC